MLNLSLDVFVILDDHLIDFWIGLLIFISHCSATIRGLANLHHLLTVQLCEAFTNPLFHSQRLGDIVDMLGLCSYTTAIPLKYYTDHLPIVDHIRKGNFWPSYLTFTLPNETNRSIIFPEGQDRPESAPEAVHQPKTLKSVSILQCKPKSFTVPSLPSLDMDSSFRVYVFLAWLGTDSFLKWRKKNIPGENYNQPAISSSDIYEAYCLVAKELGLDPLPENES